MQRCGPAWPPFRNRGRDSPICRNCQFRIMILQKCYCWNNLLSLVSNGSIQGHDRSHGHVYFLPASLLAALHVSGCVGFANDVAEAPGQGRIFRKPDPAPQDQLLELLRRRTHRREPLAELDHRQATRLNLLNDLRCPPAVEKNRFEVELLRQFIDPLQDEAVIDYGARCRLDETLPVPEVVGGHDRASNAPVLRLRGTRRKAKP